ncbi:MAG TPA: hypothetical protein VEA80_16485 [Vitreimonas sp.]|uniref:hypothetical protein n=1 Tax=Vitreimonas sp. TaxID=3069702 RepID=UPI002D270AF0|nr:hypothetical protein [Vitreimonas sp.]HYD89076.1 hypothetical protein [Vitreimonas sp.]
MSSKPLPPELEERTRPANASQPDMRTCPVCGQTYDARLLAQVYHHDDGPHEPLPPDAR